MADNSAVAQLLTSTYDTDTITMEDFCDYCGLVIIDGTNILGKDKDVADALIFCSPECRDQYRTDQM